MNNRLFNISSGAKARPVTVRRHIAAILAREILDKSSPTAFLLESEYQLCRRFGVSRVTVRLALSDLENRGLIYRKHGKGTFAHGRSTRLHRHMAVLSKSSLTTENRPLAEILRGVQTVVTPLRAIIILTSLSPEEWSPELTGVLGGVIVVAENVTVGDLDNLKARKLPYLVVGKTELYGPRILWAQKPANFNDPKITDIGNSFFEAGQRAAAALTQAFLTGEPMADILIDPFVPCNPSARIASMPYPLGSNPLNPRL